MIEVEEIGEKISESIVEFFNSEDNLKIIYSLKKIGLKLEVDNSNKYIKNILFGNSFVISGKFDGFSREELKTMVELNGGKNVSSVTSKTNYLLGGENIGPSKLNKASSSGVKIINLEDFLRMIKN